MAKPSNTFSGAMDTLSSTLSTLLTSRSVRRTISFSQSFRSRFGFRWWYLPLAAVLLAALGFAANLILERSIKAQKATELETLLNADITALEVWFGSQKGFAQVVARDPALRAGVLELVAIAGMPEGRAERLLTSPAQRGLRDYLRPLARAQGFIDYVLTSSRGVVLAAAVDAAVGNASLTRHAQFLAPALGGLTMVSRPFRAEIPLPDDSGDLVWGRPTMFVAAPVTDAEGTVVAALGLRIRPEVDFTRILHVARSGESGETYAFDANGLMVSQSRFDNDLRQIGLLPDDTSVRAIFNVEIRDPGGDMVLGFEPTVSRSRQPLTRMAEAAVSGNDGLDVDGYRDYRGVDVIGAWRWLDEYGFGVATEVGVDEAYRVLHRLRLLFRGLFALLVAATLGVVGASVLVARVGRRADAAMERARQLGQYTLQDKIGSGGMGEVYRASHAMLRRPTAIKLLAAGRANDEDLERFEREVQSTSQLTHPNTVAIYDYGRTPDGLFYYAMEYLPGLDLEALVAAAGPLPEGRAIRLLEQICGSLSEAHAAGLVHRDIKPANVIVCERGGLHDVAKVLDFGIVKDLAGPELAAETRAGHFAGTPAFVSPEQVRSRGLDGRSDLYSVGALGYYLLTGTPPFDSDNPLEVCAAHLSKTPPPVSARRGAPVAEDLATVIMDCLAKRPQDRPASADALAARLAACADAGTWDEAAARGWWEAHVAEMPEGEPSARRPDTGAGIGVTPELDPD